MMTAAIVTGSSSGIGKAIAIRLLRSGYHVILNYATDDERAEATLAECRQLAESVVLVKADVSDPGSASTLVQRAVDEFGTLDVLVNNAARVADRPVLEMSEDEWDQVVDVGLKGSFLCSQAAARQMMTQNSGSVILNIGASTGIRGRRNGINTCAAKAGLMVMTQCLALELAPKIRVNTIVPGLTFTDETERRFQLDDPSERSTQEATIPLGRLGLPEDVADAVMLLLSDDARYITGQRLLVDGGRFMV
jgi:3-oxoacyl-[acyl-carrier protein] reductase